ncbi:MAG: DUF3466 family protein [Planctomycetota bacterium]
MRTSGILALPVLLVLVTSLAPGQSYRATELGTLDGSDSQAYALNDYGQVVGRSHNLDQLMHAFHWQNGDLLDLNEEYNWGAKTLQLYSGAAFDISNTDYVVGTTQCTPISPTDETGEQDILGGAYMHACIFRPAVMSDLSSPYPGDAVTYLGTLPGGWRSRATGISRNGLFVVGVSDVDGHGNVHAFLVSPTNGNWASVDVTCEAPTNPTLIDLGTLQALDENSSASAVNNVGEAVGWSYNASYGYSAFLIVPEDIDTDGDLDWFEDDGTGVNNLMTSLGTLGGDNSWARDINDDGLVVGESDTDDWMTHAFVYDGEMHDLGTLGGNDSSAAAINSTGQIVGWSVDATGAIRAFIYQDGVMTDLNELLPSGFPVRLTHAMDINDNGEIVGWGLVGGVDGATDMAFLLTPATFSVDGGDDGGTIPVVTRTDADLEPIAAGGTDDADQTDGTGDGTTDLSRLPVLGPLYFLCGTGFTSLLPLTLAGLCCLKIGWRRR